MSTNKEENSDHITPRKGTKQLYKYWGTSKYCPLSPRILISNLKEFGNLLKLETHPSHYFWLYDTLPGLMPL